jgi:hypothetical protein
MMVAVLEREGLKMEPWGQGMVSMSPPSKDFERMLMQRNFRHPNHPILNWAASNVAIVEDAHGNIKPVRPERSEKLKVDGVIALVMSIGVSGRVEMEPGPSDHAPIWFIGPNGTISGRDDVPNAEAEEEYDRKRRIGWLTRMRENGLARAVVNKILIEQQLSPLREDEAWDD